jgi:hypothetical protein
MVWPRITSLHRKISHIFLRASHLSLNGDSHNVEESYPHDCIVLWFDYLYIFILPDNDNHKKRRNVCHCFSLNSLKKSACLCAICAFQLITTSVIIFFVHRNDCKSTVLLYYFHKYFHGLWCSHVICKNKINCWKLKTSPTDDDKGMRLIPIWSEACDFARNVWQNCLPVLWSARLVVWLTNWC